MAFSQELRTSLTIALIVTERLSESTILERRKAQVSQTRAKVGERFDTPASIKLKKSVLIVKSWLFRKYNVVKSPVF